MRANDAADEIGGDDVEIVIWRAGECLSRAWALPVGREAYIAAEAGVRTASRRAAGEAAQAGVERVAIEACEAVAEGGAT